MSSRSPGSSSAAAPVTGHRGRHAPGSPLLPPASPLPGPLRLTGCAPFSLPCLLRALGGRRSAAIRFCALSLPPMLPGPLRASQHVSRERRRFPGSAASRCRQPQWVLRFTFDNCVLCHPCPTIRRGPHIAHGIDTRIGPATRRGAPAPEQFRPGGLPPGPQGRTSRGDGCTRQWLCALGRSPSSPGGRNHPGARRQAMCAAMVVRPL